MAHPESARLKFLVEMRRRNLPMIILMLGLLAPFNSETDAQGLLSSSGPEPEKNTARILLDDIAELRQEVAELKADIAQLKAASGGLAISRGRIEVGGNETSMSDRSASNSARAMPESARPISGCLPHDSPGPSQDDSTGHSMDIPVGGPALKIRGFFDVNLGLGTDANPLVYPLGGPPHASFQLGEFDLYTTSKLSGSVSFLSEVVFGADATNNWSIDVERAQLTYKLNDYLEVGGGRFHTAIGYYNTAFHHGTWFQTAAGRPFMYYFEDSGGILPIHSVGATATGLVPGTSAWRLHWIAEVGNGENSAFLSHTSQDSPVQNFLSDKNHKAFNLAAYVKPEWLPGLQVGGSYYNDRMVPMGAPRVAQDIESAYVVYFTPHWEFLNEGVLLRDKAARSSRAFHTPLAYTQVSRKFGDYRPYFRYQYVNVPGGDPLFSSVGRYQGPSAGLRIDFTAYGAFKLQYNRLYTRDAQPQNGVDSQVAFTF